MISANRGQRDGNTFTYATSSSDEFTPSQAWDLDTLGNWSNLYEDDQSPGGIGSEDTQNPADHRKHNDANEIGAQKIEGLGYNHAYDHAGNMVTQEVPPQPPDGESKIVIAYTHDLWNRLVKVEYDTIVRAEYEYNGLNWRVSKISDSESPPDGTLDQERLMYFSANWQLVHEEIDEDYVTDPGEDRQMQYIWGLRYIDDLIARQENTDLTDDSPSDTYDKTYYHLSDVQFSSVAILNHAADVVERVSYDPYGNTRHHAPIDRTLFANFKFH